mgnify:CR=1 FL=1
MERSKVAIIIPAYNEEATILNVINKVEKYGVPIIINDCSSDKTQELINYQDNKVLYYKNPKNIGYEKSIQKGFEIAIKNNFDYLITYDADNQHFPEDILQIKQYLMEGNSIVIGERENFQRFSEKLFSKVFKFFFNIEDPLTGLKGYKSEVFIDNDQVFDSNFLVGTELLTLSLIKKKKVAKFKIKTFQRRGNSRYGLFIKGNFKILRALFFCIILCLKKKN